MASRCIVCKKELPEGSKLPVCEYHKGVAAENAKKAVIGALAVVGTVAIAARDTVDPVVKDKALPVAKKAAEIIRKH